MSDPSVWAVLPTYDNPETVRQVVVGVRAHLDHVLVVDDGSAEAGRRACAALERDGLARVLRLPVNGGKGAAMRRGFREAAALGATHAFQIDADAQHDLDAIPDFLSVVRERPDVAVFGAPIYDESAPASRRRGREITRFFVDIEVGADRVADALIGFRIYPLAPTLRLPLRTDRMAFDVEAAVLLAWSGVPIVNRPVRIRYLTEAEGGRSHFRLFRDNLALSALHARFFTEAAIRFCFGRDPRRLPRGLA